MMMSWGRGSKLATRDPMPSMWSFLRGLICFSVFYPQPLKAQQPAGAPNVPTIQVTSRLVFLDVTVLDKKGPHRGKRAHQR